MLEQYSFLFMLTEEKNKNFIIKNLSFYIFLLHVWYVTIILKQQSFNNFSYSFNIFTIKNYLLYIFPYKR